MSAKALDRVAWSGHFNSATTSSLLVPQRQSRSSAALGHPSLTFYGKVRRRWVTPSDAQITSGFTHTPRSPMTTPRDDRLKT